MERNIGEQLNKAFEAYRQASIEKENVKKDLEKMTDYYERYTQELQKKIEDQRQLIVRLESQLLSATKQPSGLMKCELIPRKQEEDTLLPCNHLLDGTTGFRKMQYLKENMETAVAVAPKLPINKHFDNQGVLEVFEAIQGKFQQIRFLTRRQKDHLKRFNGNDSSNDQQFSMPIQCTDGTAELVERPFPSTLRSAVEIPQSSTVLASRGSIPEDRDLVESLTKLSVKFPPTTDSEYDFLNSAPERQIALAVPGKRVLRGGPTAVKEEVSVELTMPFDYPLPPSLSTSPPNTSLSEESVRGPQQPLWSPDLCELEQAQSSCPDLCDLEQAHSSSPDKCAFCHAIVPQDRMNSHLYSHFSHKSEASN